jgi:hypothetical protein
MSSTMEMPHSLSLLPSFTNSYLLTSVLAANLVPGLIHHCWHFSRVAPPSYVIQSWRPAGGVIGMSIRNKTLLFAAAQARRSWTNANGYRAGGRNGYDGREQIVLLAHIGLAKDLEWMAGIEGVDIVVGELPHSWG